MLHTPQAVGNLWVAGVGHVRYRSSLCRTLDLARTRPAPASNTAIEGEGKVATAQERERVRLAQRVVRARDKRQMSWLQIAAEYNVSPGTARRLYDEVQGEGAHVGLLPGKGGRLPTPKPKAKAKAKTTVRRAA